MMMLKNKRTAIMKTIFRLFFKMVMVLPRCRMMMISLLRYRMKMISFLRHRMKMTEVMPPCRDGLEPYIGLALQICRKVNKYSRFINCFSRMQAEMQKADDGDEDLAKDMLKRITNLQEEGGDGDAEAQFL